jgi:hypothetical protein
MTTGSGKYMNPRDGDVIEFDVDVLDDGNVRITRSEIRGCDAARRAAAELPRRLRYDGADDVVRVEFGALLAALHLEPDEERCALSVVNAFQAALVDAETKELA